MKIWTLSLGFTDVRNLTCVSEGTECFEQYFGGNSIILRPTVLNEWSVDRMISLKAKNYLLQLSKLEKKNLLKYDEIGYQIAVAGETIKPCLYEKAWEKLSTATAW